MQDEDTHTCPRCGRWSKSDDVLCDRCAGDVWREYRERVASKRIVAGLVVLLHLCSVVVAGILLRSMW